MTRSGYDTGHRYGGKLTGGTWQDLKLPSLGVWSSPVSVVANGGRLTVGGAYNPPDWSMHTLPISSKP